MPEYPKKITEDDVAEAAKLLVPLLERKRVLTFQRDWHRSPLIREELKEELQIVNLTLDKKYKLITDYYKKNGGYR